MNRVFAGFPAALAVGLAARASAVTVSFQYEGHGRWAASRYAVDTVGFAPVALPGATAKATALAYRFTPSEDGFTDGAGLLTLGAGNAIGFTFEGFSEASGDGLMATALTLGNGTGALWGYAGTGIMSHSINPSDGSLVGGQLDLSLSPVPEPASLAALGVGAVGLLRRRARRGL